MALILLIDDDVNIRNSFRFFLEREGHNIIEAENGALGVELFDQKNPDLVVVDLHMPVMDGFGVLKAVTEKSPDTSIIVVSGNDVIEDAVKAVQMGAWDYLLKPIYEFSALTHAVENGLERSRLIRENKAYQENLEKEVVKRTQELEIANQKLKAFNEKLKASEEKLQKANLELEKRVHERTAELERMNKELLKAKETADAATEAKSSFLANMSHEIRTPMNGVIAATDLALEENVSPKVLNYLNIIQSSGRLLLGIINDILDFSKIEAGKLELERHSFDLEKVIENVVSQVIHKALEKEIALIVNMEPSTPVYYMGDSLRLQQILTNLLGNAIKFTSNKGTITLGIAEDTRKQHDNFGTLQFYIKDTGIGMSTEQINKLFKPFSQADSSTTRQFGGTGLGLSICRQLVEMMEGRIWVDSKEGAGTTFHFYVTFENDESKDKGIRHSAVVNLKTIVIASNINRIEVIRKYLKYLNHHVRVLEPGKEAVSQIINDYSTERSINLIIVDGDEKKADPLHMINFFQENLGIKIPIIVLTFPNSDIDRKLSARNRLRTVLYKPVYPSSLVRAMESLFNIPHPGLENTEPDFRQQMVEKNKALRVLVVEDNMTNQLIATAILKKAGMLSNIAANGKEAVAAVKNAEYDAVLMDIHMPEMDGLEATRIIREDLEKRDLPIIAMTANALKGDREKCLDAGMVGYVTKPINQEELLKTLFEKSRKRENSSTASAVEESDPNNLEIPGVSIKDILSTLSLDIDTVKEILVSFFKANQTFIKDLKSTYRSGNLNNLWRMAHTLKGASSNIRAYALQNAAKELEDSLSDLLNGGNMSDLDPGLIESLDTEMNIVLNSLGDYLKSELLD